MTGAVHSGEMLEVAGYASLFDIKDHGGDVVHVGAFKASLLKRPPAQVRMLFIGLFVSLALPAWSATADIFNNITVYYNYIILPIYTHLASYINIKSY